MGELLYFNALWVVRKCKHCYCYFHGERLNKSFYYGEILLIQWIFFKNVFLCLLSKFYVLLFMLGSSFCTNNLLLLKGVLIR